MGGVTFFKVGGGHKCTSKNLQTICVVWIGNCDVTSIEIWRHYLCTIWRSNYTILGKITPLWKRIGGTPEIRIGCYKGDTGQQRHSSSSYDFFWLNITVRRLRHWNFHLLFFLAGTIGAVWRLLRNSEWEVHMITFPLLSWVELSLFGDN